VAQLRRPDPTPPEWIPPAVTWTDLVDEEPRLGLLEREILYHAAQHKTGRYCASRFWHGYAGTGFKDRLLELVGWETDRPTLRSSEAYDVAYDHLYELLPDCRHDSVFCA